MPTPETEPLRRLLDGAVKSLPKVTWRRMFGCDAVFADGTIFGLVWKKGRLGVKLPDEAEFRSLMSLPGSEPWKAGPMTMAHWVLLPGIPLPDKGSVANWVKKAYRSALLNPKAKKPAKR